MTATVPDLSIIIPAYNEESRLPETLAKIAAWIRESGRETEVLLVDDGSTDRTAVVAENMRSQLPALRLISNGVNRGKGFSVRHGMLEARGRLALFTDADLSAPIDEAGKLLTAVNRSLISARQSLFREFAGIVFNTVVRLCLRLPFVDTQCGFKAFQREPCKIIFEQQRIERFGFDPELLYLARHHGLRATEIPVRWAHSPGTKVSMFRDSVQMFADVFIIRWNALAGRYPRKR
jgi:dolichyl-phosphate beta-glucosyltransferase